MPGEGIEHLAAQLRGGEAVRKAALDGQRHERARIEQPAAFFARNGGDRLPVDRVVHRLQRQPGKDGGLGRREQGIVRLHGLVHNHSLYGEYIL